MLRKLNKHRRNPDPVSLGSLLQAVPLEVRELAQKLKRAGAKRVLLIGGAVIDLVQGNDIKDWDIEVAGLTMDRLTQVAKSIGTADEVGKSFGIVKLVLPSGLDVDLNVPRRDSKTGKGHKDFRIDVDPNMSVIEAARRRDFTINTMGLDLASGEFHDPFNGLSDLEAGILRATDFDLFQDDPLRALRAMQLVARKVDKVDPATMNLIKSIKSEQVNLPKERIREEWRKLLLKGKKPSRGLEFLKESGWIEHYPELIPLEATPQHPDWHPEGDVWIHTKQAADAAAQVRHMVPEDQREAFVFGAMLHDVGKPKMTITPEMVRRGEAPEDRLYTAYGHDVEGGPLAASFMDRMGAPKKVEALTKALVEAHMRPYSLVSGKAKKGGYAKLHRDIAAAGGDLRVLARVCQCDACATGRMKGFKSTGEPDWEHETSRELLGWADEFEKEPVVPLILGRDLIAAGVKPGPQMGKLLAQALELQDEGLSKDEILSVILLKKNPKLRRNSKDGLRKLKDLDDKAVPRHLRRLKAFLPELVTKPGPDDYVQMRDSRGGLANRPLKTVSINELIRHITFFIDRYHKEMNPEDFAKVENFLDAPSPKQAEKVIKALKVHVKDELIYDEPSGAFIATSPIARLQLGIKYNFCLGKVIGDDPFEEAIAVELNGVVYFHSFTRDYWESKRRNNLPGGGEEAKARALMNKYRGDIVIEVPGGSRRVPMVDLLEDLLAYVDVSRSKTLVQGDGTRSAYRWYRESRPQVDAKLFQQIRKLRSITASGLHASDLPPKQQKIASAASDGLANLGYELRFYEEGWYNDLIKSGLVPPDFESDESDTRKRKGKWYGRTNPLIRFTPTTEWQVVPEDSIVPPGLDVRFSGDGKTYARWAKGIDPSPKPEKRDSSASLNTVTDRDLAAYNEAYRKAGLNQEVPKPSTKASRVEIKQAAGKYHIYLDGKDTGKWAASMAKAESIAARFV